jgi:hypothetical protein
MRIESACEVWTRRVGIQAILKSKAEWLIVAAISAVGTVFRLVSPKMSADLWYDEVFSLFVAQQPFAHMLHNLYLGVPTGARMDPGDTNPPLYTVLLHLWMRMGSSDRHVKYLSLVFGVASIWAIWLLVRRVAGKLGGLVSCLLLAVSPLAIYYSIEARPYAMFLFFSLLSTFFFLSAIGKAELEERNTSSSSLMPAGYLVATILVVYTHWFGLLLMPVHAVGLVVYGPASARSVRRYLLSWIAIGCCCLPLVPFLLNQIRLQSAVGGFTWPGQPGLGSLFELALLTAGGQSLLALTAAFFLIAYLGKNDQMVEQGRRLRNGNMFFIAYVLLPVILVYAASALMAHYTFFVPRYFLPFLAGVYVLIGLAMSRIELKMALAWVLVLVLVPAFEAIRFSQPPANPYSRLASELSLREEPGVLIAHLSPMSYYPVLHYRRNSAARDKVLWNPASGGGYLIEYKLGGAMIDQNDLVEVGAELRKYRELWIVADPVGAGPETEGLGEWLRNDEDFSLVSEERIGQVSLKHYRLRSAAPRP